MDKIFYSFLSLTDKIFYSFLSLKQTEWIKFVRKLNLLHKLIFNQSQINMKNFSN